MKYFYILFPKYKALVSFILSIAIFSYCNISLSQPFSYKFNYLTVDMGLSHTDANCIAQDNKGYIWIGTHFGLNRFDGYNIKKYYNTNEAINNAYKNRIRSIFPDGNGNIWLATEGGLQCFNSKTEKYTDYYIQGVKEQPTMGLLMKRKDNTFFDIINGQIYYYLIKGKFIDVQKIPQPKEVKFWDMAKDSSDKIYLSSNSGVWTMDKDRNLSRIRITGCSQTDFSKIYIDKQQNLFVTHERDIYLTSKSLFKLGVGDNVIYTISKKYTCPEGMFADQIFEDNNSNYWVNGKTGIINLDQNINFLHSITNKQSGFGLNSRSIARILIDRSQCLWVCTYGGGVNYRDLFEKKFFTLQHDTENPNSISGNYVRAILEEPGKGIWIGTDYNGLNFYNNKSGLLSFYNNDKAKVKLKSSNIYSLNFDDDKNLWIGGSAGIEILKPNRTQLWIPPGGDKFPHFSIETLAKDFYGNMWFGNHMDKFGVIWKDAQNRYQVKYYGEGYFIFPDHEKPEVFVSSTKGLKRLWIDKEGNIIKTYNYQATGHTNSLSSNYTYPVCKQNDSTYWIGTIGGGLNRLVIQKNNAYTIKSYSEKDGVFNDVESLEIDDNDNIWMGGNGLLCLNPNTGKLVKYVKADGLQGNSFKVGSSFKGADGILYFGGINGLNFFNPADIKINMTPSHPIFTDVLINNKKVNYGTKVSNENSLTQIVSYLETLKLNYLQNNFVISFSAMHFANPLKCKYRYMLAGYDKDWVYTDGKNPTATYNNLDYNDYNFIVEASNNDEIWSNDQAKIKIIITPPWWKSLLAKIIYFVFFMAGLLSIYIYQARWYRLKRELAIREINEKKTAEMHKQREELYNQQLQFFTNISHEFRTPLTLILGPLESLINDARNASLNSSLQLMFRNVKRLVNLINELMNFKKAADGAIKLQVQPLAIHDFCENIFHEFQIMADNKNIDFQFINHTNNKLTNLFDAQILEKILFNLLNNAIKYTNENGKVTFELFPVNDKPTIKFTNEFHLTYGDINAENYLYFLITDTGIGISADSIGSIFDRYFQIGKNHLGSGIGLALVKTLTQIHKGNISVYSERNKGTEFLVAIPWGENNFKQNERYSQENELNTSQLEEIDNSILSSMQYNNQDDVNLPEKMCKYILLVDDNHELRSFLKQALQKYYIIFEAEDGEEALDIAVNKIPDLIISDVMMPKMNGIDLCKQLKDKFETSHIPFIILSAKDALEAKLEGMESGADYYFAKPLSVDLLVLTVHNIFQQSQKLKNKYTKDYQTNATELVHSEKDKEFINKLLKLIEDNIQDPNLDVDFLCNNLFISRSKLYQKIKSISDLSIGDFIKTIRLKSAIHIMTHEIIPLSEVAYRIGLQSPAYFSRLFKKEFGESPSDYMHSLKKNGEISSETTINEEI